jgi:hypothetical protein
MRSNNTNNSKPRLSLPKRILSYLRNNGDRRYKGIRFDRSK